MTINLPADDLEATRQLVELLAIVNAPTENDRGDDATSRAKMRTALVVTDGAQSRITAHIRTASSRVDGDDAVLPRSYVRVASMLRALVDRAVWLHHAWLCAIYCMDNHRLTFELEPVLFDPD